MRSTAVPQLLPVWIIIALEKLVDEVVLPSIRVATQLFSSGGSFYKGETWVHSCGSENLWPINQRADFVSLCRRDLILKIS